MNFSSYKFLLKHYNIIIKNYKIPVEYALRTKKSNWYESDSESNSNFL